jgi:hypothetical protein
MSRTLCSLLVCSLDDKILLVPQTLSQTLLLQAECDKLRGDLASNIELLSAEAASNLARSQEIIMLNQEVARLKVSVRF